MIDVCFVHPDASASYSRLKPLAAVETPIWAAMLAGHARRQGLEVALIDQEALGLTPQALAAQVEALEPRLVAVVVYGHHPSASTQTMPAARAAARAIHAAAPEARILFVGGHAAALPTRTLLEEACDGVATGEGFATVAEFARALRTDKWANKVPGLAYRHAFDFDAVFVNPPAPNLERLDEVVPAWDLLPMQRYRAHNWHALGYPSREGYASLYTTLGCPFDCSFCCIQAPFRAGESKSTLNVVSSDAPRSYRRWSPKAVVEQLLVLRQVYAVRHVKIADEMFVLNASHVTEICREIVKHRSLDDLNLWAYGRVDTLKEGMPEMLRGAGFRWIALGIESGDEAVRDAASKGFAQEKTFDAVERLRRAGIAVNANYIFGLPGETFDSMHRTMKLSCELNTEWANFYCAAAYPGSPLYQQAVREKWPLPASWSDYHQHSPDFQPLGTDALPAAEVVRYRDRAHQLYFARPEYLSMIEAKFGSKGLEQIHEMNALKIERRSP